MGGAELDPWLACMCGALQETIANEAARAEIDLALSTLADCSRNLAGNPV
ncbi:hypothetical protein ACF1BQ_031945 [Bradyrhizobium sp. RDT10]